MNKLWIALLFGAVCLPRSIDGEDLEDTVDCPCTGNTDKQYNILWLLIDDVSAERFPEYGNQALEGMLPGIGKLKEADGVYYEHFYAPASICSPSQVALFSSKESGDIGGQYQFSSDIYDGKLSYRVVPDPEVQFVPEILRAAGYYSVGGGKLDYQIGELMPTFYQRIAGGAFSDIHPFMDQVWEPVLDEDNEAYDRPFFGMLNMMDVHQQFSAFTEDEPIKISVPYTNGEEFYNTSVLPFGEYGYTAPEKLIFNIDGEEVGVAPITVKNNFLANDVAGYEGDFDETTLSHANNGVPGYLPDENGMRSILSREYDLIRNMDFRVGTIVDILKDKGLFDDTAIFLFGDHGSGTHKGKFMLQPQSLRPPLWIKYPADMPLSDHVEVGADGFNVDRRLNGIIDLFPTALSVAGIEPPSWMTGRALGGPCEFCGEDREMMFGISQRLAAARAWKSFAVFNKDFFWQKHLMTTSAIEAYQELAEDSPELELLSDTVLRTSRYSGPYAIFAVSPLYDRIRRLMYQNAAIDLDNYDKRYFSLAADDQRPPPELLYDLRSDPYGTTNLLYNYEYTVNVGTTEQVWGNMVSSVTVEYSKVDEADLSDEVNEIVALFNQSLYEWIETQEWVTPDIDWSEDFWGEENKMARIMWPDTPSQPITDIVHFSSIYPTGFGVALVELLSPTDGTVYRYSVVTPERRAVCETIGDDIKNMIPRMNIVKSGIPPYPSYTSVRNGVTYNDGYLYGEEVGEPSRDLTILTPLGANPGCSLFVSSDATFMELDCPLRSPFVFDTRDATWDGTTWVGVDEETGEWTGDKVTFYDPDTFNWNPDAFESYVYGPDRVLIYNGFYPNGTKFVGTSRNQATLDKEYDPAPFYWAEPEWNVTENPTKFVDEIWITKGWEVNFDDRRTNFEVGDQIGQHKKGSWDLIFNQRRLSPPAIVENELYYDSYNYNCLLWEVGTQVELDFQGTNSSVLHTFTQGVRKGYRDSEIVEIIFETPVRLCQAGKLLNGNNRCKNICKANNGEIYDPIIDACVEPEHNCPDGMKLNPRKNKCFMP